MNHSVKTRLLAMFLAIVMVIGYVPTAALANETELEGKTPGTTDVVEESSQMPSEEESQEAPEEESQEAPEKESEEVTEETKSVKYIVNYYKWDWDLMEDVLIESEELTGIPGEFTNVQDKAYEGLILVDEIAQVEIAADGTTVVDVYYTVELDASAFAGSSDLYDTTVSNDYFTILDEKTYDLAPGAKEHGLVLNNSDGSDRKAVHIFEVDTKNEDILVLPGYYAIDKLDPDNLPLDGIVDKAEYWKAMELTKTVKYYEGMGYNVVGAMNTALAYDSDAPYGYMVMEGVVLGTPEVHKGAQTYLAIDWEGNCELRSMSTPLDGTERTAISANFGWLVKDGALHDYKTLERDSSDASRSMIGIKEDGTLIFCHVDGRNAPISTGLSNYEMGEMMLALGCVNAVNCDGGGSSTFVSKRAGETSNTMRSVPSDGAERPTINSVILATKAGATGIFDSVLFGAEYEYISPGAFMPVTVTGQDTNNYIMDIPAEVTYQVADGMGSIANGVFTAGTEIGTATIQAVYNGEIVGEHTVEIVHPKTFVFNPNETVIPYGRTVPLAVETAYGSDNRAVCVDGAYTIALSDNNAATLDGYTLIATEDESVKGVDVIATYTPDPAVTATLKVEYGKGSEIVYSFENGEHTNFMGVDEMYAWAKANGAPAPIQSNGNYSEDADSVVFLADKNNGQVRNGDHSLGVTLDYRVAQYAGWSYNMFFHNIMDVEDRVLRDVANGKNATTFGMWVYIPEGAAGLAMQMQGCTKPDGSGPNGGHFYFTTVSGAKKNLNSCTEEDIPASRWVYATFDLTAMGDYFALYNPMGNTGREPSFIRFYVKPTTAANLTFYFDDFTLDYSPAVDDRILPTITEISYAAGDTAAALENGATIASGSASFTAKAADVGAAGLNTKSAQIFLDGNPVDTVLNGQIMATANDLILSEGKHIVTFEISDNLGKGMQVSRAFTVNTTNAEAPKGIVYLAGHNDSGEMAEYDSVYYVDLKTSDAEAVNYIEANIQLNSANKWELDQLIVAPGYEVEYTLLDADREVVAFSTNSDIHSVENVVAISLTRLDDCTLTGEQTLLSLPVRLWSWDGVNHVTGKPITPEEQYKTGYCPIVNVTASVLFGYAETASGDVTFGGGIDEKTKINDTVYPWHYHDAVLTVQNQAATCTVNGYENRTYCETCKSVVDWGTKLEATGHTYEIVDNQLKCHCGHILGGNGLVHANDKIYVLIADKLVTGWQNVDGKWVYAAVSTKEVQTGKITVNKLTYTTDENGFVIKGAWVAEEDGIKYSYGPNFYHREWVEIEGKTYYFDEYFHMYTGVRFIPVNRSNPKEGIIWYEFAEDGAYIGKVNGFVSYNDLKYYVVNGEFNYGGLLHLDTDGDGEPDAYYYARTSGEIVCGRSYWITKNNDLLPVGTYTFDADGKMVNPPATEEPEPEQPVIKNGVCADENGKLWYYVDGVKTYGGLLHLDTDGDGEPDAYYYARTSGEIVVNKAYTISKNNDLLPVGYYTFGADGKMVNPPATEEPEPEQPVVKNGVCADENGKLWYYVDGVKTYGGLLYLDTDGDGEPDAYYYARTSGEIVINRAYTISKNNDLLPIGTYTFGADGKMVQ